MLHPVPGTDGNRGRCRHSALPRSAHPRAHRAGDDPVETGDPAFHVSESLGVCDDCEEVILFLKKFKVGTIKLCIFGYRRKIGKNAITFFSSSHSVDNAISYMDVPCPHISNFELVGHTFLLQQNELDTVDNQN